MAPNWWCISESLQLPALSPPPLGQVADPWLLSGRRDRRYINPPTMCFFPPTFGCCLFQAPANYLPRLRWVPLCVCALLLWLMMLIFSWSSSLKKWVSVLLLFGWGLGCVEGGFYGCFGEECSCGWLGWRYVRRRMWWESSGSTRRGLGIVPSGKRRQWFTVAVGLVPLKIIAAWDELEKKGCSAPRAW